jgi:hypothetical protein
VHHVDQPDQVVSPGEELWVKIIDIDLARRRISLSIKQAAEGGEVAAEYREAFGEHAYDEHGNYIGAGYTPFEPESEAQAAWAGYLEEQAHGAGTTPGSSEAPGGDAELGAVPDASSGAQAAAEPESVETIEFGEDAAGEPEVLEPEVLEPEVLDPEVLDIVEVVDAAGNAEVVAVEEIVSGTEIVADTGAQAASPEPGTAPAG